MLLIAHAIFSQIYRNDILGGFVDPKVQFAPCAEFAGSVLSDFPLAFAVYFKPCRVYNQMNLFSTFENFQNSVHRR